MTRTDWRAKVAATAWDTLECDVTEPPQCMTVATVRRIHELRARGGTYEQIARAVGWSAPYVAKICTRTAAVVKGWAA